MRYNIVHSIKKRSDCIVFIFCDNYKAEIKKIQKEMKINFPASFLTDFNGNSIKTVYLDKLAIILAGMGKDCSLEHYAQSSSTLGRYLLKHKFKHVSLVCSSTDLDTVRILIENLILSLYEYTHYKTNKKPITIKQVDFVVANSKKLLNLKNSIILAENANLARDYINAPANDCNSTWFLGEMKRTAPKDLKFKVYNKKQLQKMGMNLLLSVNQGSKYPVYLVEIHYGNTKDRPIVLVGKGVMFDSGGYSLKRGDFSDMKTDMGGAAVIFETMRSLSMTKAKGSYIALLPLVENMINEHATRPGDVVKSHSGLTVEISDTDAEGRLILADAISWSKKFKPKLIIDVATLTGSAEKMLDAHGTIFMTNNNKYSSELIKIAEKTGEKVWEMPMWRNFMELTKSNIADVRNVAEAGHGAGAIIAGCFLYNFVPKNVGFIHCDIAGVTFLKHANKYRNAGATGDFVRNLYYYLKSI
jgi:leucyl aminopeptidase